LQKAREGAAHPDRNAQFEHINATATAFIRRRQPVISVDTNYDPCPLMGNISDAGCSPVCPDGPAAAHLIPAVYT
jgi:hypothetical protein